MTAVELHGDLDQKQRDRRMGRSEPWDREHRGEPPCAMPDPRRMGF